MPSKNFQSDPVTKVLSPAQTLAAIPKIKRRLEELSTLNVSALDNINGKQSLDSHRQKINASLREIYGSDSLEYVEYSIETFMPIFYVTSEHTDFSVSGNLETIRDKVRSAMTMLTTLLQTLEEQAEVSEGDTASQSIRAYEGMDLHDEIARAASQLFRDGHYANAVEASVKALNGLVRLRSGLEFDGTTLMERAFSPSNPVLKFNGLSDQSDKDEQKGYMQMFSGAVSGLRNPRAHGFIHDKPERALEFIAFVSLLAKLLDEAK